MRHWAFFPLFIYIYINLQAPVGRKEKIKASRSVHKTKHVDVPIQPHLDALFKLVLSHEPDHVGHRGWKATKKESGETIHVNNLEAPKRLHKRASVSANTTQR